MYNYDKEWKIFDTLLKIEHHIGIPISLQFLYLGIEMES